MLTPHGILGPQGRIARRLPNYRFRPPQLEMANAVAEALAESRHLIVEAGTGVGKSFGYLVPAILAVTDPDNDIERVIVSTHTISLQEQLLTKDLPLLNAVIPREFTAVLGKGRGNYISLRRLARASKKERSLFVGAEADQLDAIHQWLDDTVDGSLSDLPFEPTPALWQEIESDASNCLRKSCSRYDVCFYYQAQRRMRHAQIVVVNHALFFTDLALRAARARGVLPSYDAVIFDEAHTIESVAGEYFGIQVGSGQVAYQLRRLFNPRTQKGHLTGKRYETLRKEVIACDRAARQWFESVHAKLATRSDSPVPSTSPSPVRVLKPIVDPGPLVEKLRRLASQLHERAGKLKKPDERVELESAATRLRVLASAIQLWSRQEDASLVYWLESQSRRDGSSRIRLSAAPVDVAPALEKHLFQSVPRVILASATLTTGQREGFAFFQQRIGLRHAETLQVGSPFDYDRQMKLILVRGLPDPGRQREAFEQACLRLLPHYLEQTHGRAFCLFTSYAFLRKATRYLEPWAQKHEIGLFPQGAGTPRHQLLEQFKKHPAAVLLGTASFWQGVDVPGEALQNVIIPKLPFSVPDHPLIQARLEAIRERGGNPFMEYSVPEAVIRLKQGFGRLIRSTEDRGMVVILDPRILSKPYGRVFLEALPECPRYVDECSATGEVLSHP